MVVAEGVGKGRIQYLRRFEYGSLSDLFGTFVDIKYDCFTALVHSCYINGIWNTRSKIA
jgi:hypothetical protein